MINLYRKIFINSLFNHFARFNPYFQLIMYAHIFTKSIFWLYSKKKNIKKIFSYIVFGIFPEFYI